MNEQQVFEAVFKATGVSDFQKAIAGAQESIKSFESASKKIRDTGKTLTKAVTLPLVGLGVASGKVASDFETAMTGVAKTTDLTAQEFSDMEDAILEMTRVIPASATEIAGVAEAAGQLGIEKENILGFTETMVNLGVATNMSAEEAATSLARLANITGMPQTEFDKLGSVIVELGNNLATTEGEIVEMGLRLAGTASQVGLTESEIMALAGAMSSVGISAEAGGTAMSTVMQKINTSVLSGSEEINGFAKVAGMSAKEFATAWEDSPQTAITAFIEGLGGMNAEGVDTVTMLKDLGISGIREVDTLNRLSGASGLLAESFGMASGAWEENTALSEEAQTAYETTANKIQLAKNAIVEAGIALGDHLLPYVQQVAEFVADLAQRFSSLNPAIQVTTIVIGAIVAAIGPLLMLVGQIGLGISALGTFFVGTAGSVSVFATIIGALTNPVTLVIAAIAALAGVIVYLYQTNEEFRNKVQEIWTNIQLIFEEVTMIISEILTMVFDALSAWWAENQQGFMDIVNNVWTAISEFFIVIFTAIGDIINAIWQPISDWYQENNKLIGETISVVWNAIAGVFMAVMAIIGGSVTAGFNIVSSVIEAVMPYVKTIIDSVMYAIMNVISLVMGIISGDWDAVWTSIKNIARSIWDAIKALVEGAIEGVKAIISSVLDAIFGDWSAKWNQIKNKVSEIWEGIKSAVSTKINDVKTSISEGIQGALDTVTGFFGKFKEAGSNIVGNIASGIRGAIGKVTEAIGSVTQKIADFLPNSPPKDKSSPLMNLHKHAIGEEVARGIYDGEGEIQRAMNRALDVDMPMVNGRVNHSVNMNNGRTENLLEQLVNSNQVIVLDSGELVGATYSQYDRVGGNQTQLTERWGR